MYTIGFTSKFFTLWDVTVEHFTNAYGRKGERVTAAYIKNVSMDEQTARAKYPDAPVDMSLRGHSSFTRTNWEPLPSDVFPCGKYAGEPIAECSDWSYLYWAVDTQMLCGESRDIAVAVLLKSGEYAEYNGRLLTAARVAEIEQADAALDEIIAAIDANGVVEVVSKTNIQPWDSEVGDDFLTHYVCGSYTTVDGVNVYWPESMVNWFQYNGYDYGLPVKGGKAKRIKGKTIKLVVGSYTVDQCNWGRRLNINVLDFEMVK